MTSHELPRTTARATALAFALAAWALTAACAQPTTTDDDAPEQVRAALTSGTPCAARAAAVIANTGNVVSNAGTLVDSYQSSLGPYGGANIGNQGAVQAAHAIVANGGVIHGPQTPNTPAGLAVVPVPAGATNLPLGAGSPGTVNINSAAQSITLAPGNYVAAGININGTGAINVSPPGAVQIWVTGGLNLGGVENNNGTPANLAFLVTGTTQANLNSGGKLFGTVYAPAAVVNVNSAVFGGVTGSAVNLNPGAAVHFDTSSTCPPPPPRTITMGPNGAFVCTAGAGSGVAFCWGQNTNGQVGNDTTTDTFAPVETSVVTDTITSISAGGGHSCVINAAGGLECWGDDTFGQLGDGIANPGTQTVTRLTPVPVVGLSSGVKAVSAGFENTCAITTAGALLCWGENTNAGATSSVPVPVPGLSSGVAAVTTGTACNCALTVTGAVFCWGSNAFGELGNGTTVDSNDPVAVVGLSSGVKAIAAGTQNVCAITAAGAVVCWGANFSGALGDGTTTNSSVPVQVTGLTSGATAVSAGFNFACAVVAGAVTCWGSDKNGALGNGSTVDSAVPVAVTGLGSGVVSVASGIASSCALTSSGGIRCWGENAAGELGNGSTVPFSSTPVAVLGFP